MGKDNGDYILQHIGWDTGEDRASNRKRSQVIWSIIQNRNTAHLEAILDHGWDVNERLSHHKSGIWWRWQVTIALHEAVRQRWKQGVEILLNAGARYGHSTLRLALQPGIQTAIVDLLLEHDTDQRLQDCYMKWKRGRRKHVLGRLGWAGGKDNISLSKRTNTIHAIIANHCVEHLQMIVEHGWDVNELLKVPTGTALTEAVYHDWQEGVRILLTAGADGDLGRKYSPLEIAITSNMKDLAEILLENGASANAHVDKEPPLITALIASVRNAYDTVLLRLLFKHGADPNQFEKSPFLHRIVTLVGGNRKPRFSLDQLELYFQYGGDVDMKDNDGEAGLQHAVRLCGHANTIRWLIRHGADASCIKFHLFLKHLLCPPMALNQTPLVLLQAGLTVPWAAIQSLIAVMRAIQKFLHNGQVASDKDALVATAAYQCAKLKQIEKADMRNLFPIKPVFPKHNTQMDDLLRFSNETLYVYPEEECTTKNSSDTWRHSLDIIQGLVDFLSQPHSLQWWCRSCIRGSLVSLAPSAVFGLPGPASLKRYILCHDI